MPDVSRERRHNLYITARLGMGHHTPVSEISFQNEDLKTHLCFSFMGGHVLCTSVPNSLLFWPCHSTMTGSQVTSSSLLPLPVLDEQIENSPAQKGLGVLMERAWI